MAPFICAIAAGVPSESPAAPLPPSPAGNGGSLEKCRRRWDICDNPQLRYQHMVAYDRAMIHLDKAFGYIAAPHQWVSRQDNADKVRPSRMRDTSL